jgi:hypothetical protein
MIAQLTRNKRSALLTFAVSAKQIAPVALERCEQSGTEWQGLMCHYHLAEVRKGEFS